MGEPYTVDNAVTDYMAEIAAQKGPPRYRGQRMFEAWTFPTSALFKSTRLLRAKLRISAILLLAVADPSPMTNFIVQWWLISRSNPSTWLFLHL